MTKVYDKAFTAKVAQLIAEGYTIASAPMGGSQGEMAKVCFSKDGKFYALYLSHVTYSHWSWYDDAIPDEDKGEPWDTVDLVFGEAEPGYHGSETMWLNHLQEISREKFYIIGSFYNNCQMTQDRAAAVAACKLHIARLKARSYSDKAAHEHTLDISNDCVATAAYRMLKRRDGYKMLRKHQVVGVKVTERLARNNIVVGIRKADGSLKSVTIFSAKSAA